jgi:hypothetical protein
MDSLSEFPQLLLLLLLLVMLLSRSVAIDLDVPTS